MRERWRLHKGEVRGELRLLLGRHSGHAWVTRHAAVLEWLLLLQLLGTFSEVAALLHLLLHEHSMLIEAWRSACRHALRLTAAWVWASHGWLIWSRHLWRCIT